MIWCVLSVSGVSFSRLLLLIVLMFVSYLDFNGLLQHEIFLPLFDHGFKCWIFALMLTFTNNSDVMTFSISALV